MKINCILFVCLSVFLCSCDLFKEQPSDSKELLVLKIEHGEWTSLFDKAAIAQQAKTKYKLDDTEDPSDIIQIELDGMVDEILFYTTPEMGESFHFVSSSIENDITHLFFGVNSDLLYTYYDFQVENIAGKWVIKDVLNVYTGERLNERILGFYDAQDKSNREMVSPMFNDYIERNCDAAWTYYTSLPEKIQLLPEFIEIKIDVASCISDSFAYQIREKLINSTALSAQSKALHQVELGRVSSDVNLLQEAIPKLKKFIGEDPYLEQLLPKAFARNRQFKKSLSGINQFLEKYPDSEWGHYFKLDIYLFSGNETEAKQWLGQIKEHFTVDSTYLVSLYEIHPELQ